MERKTPGVCGSRGPKKKRLEEKAAPENLQELEEDFFTVIAAGNIGTLRQFMKKHTVDGSLDFNVNCSNFQNDNAMTVAVDKSNLEMIKYLFQVMSMTKNSILLKAIHRGDLDLVRGLCESLSADEEALDNCYKVTAGEADYPEFMTPLMVAAVEGQYEIVGYLLDRGHKMGDPHQPGCFCEEDCMATLAVSDPLHLSLSQFHTYSAMGNPAYIPYATADPIRYCFQLHRRLQLLSKTDLPFHSCYKSLANEVSQFAASLVAECRTSREVEIILKQPRTGQTCLQSEYPRLLMAIDFNQTEFISEPKIQLFIEHEFYGAFDDWPYLNTFQKIYTILARILTTPLAYLSFLANPKSKKSAYYATPVNKMLHYLATYLLFLGLLFMETREPKPSEHQYEMSSVWSFLIFLYFYGFAAFLVYTIMHTGLKSFLRQSWNVFDLTMAVMFALFVAFSVSSLVHVRMGGLVEVGESAERKVWSMFDPQLMAEGFLVMATLMAYWKVLFFLQVHRILGPMQVAQYQLTKYLACFCLYAVVVLLGYSVAFSHFYSYYSGMFYVDPETKAKSLQEESFTDVLNSLKTFFWGFFGQSGSSAADVVLESNNQHVFTELVGYAALGSFLVVTVVVLKSMLVAMAVKSYQDRDVHKAWLFKRTQIFLYFIDSPLLPPPFNLLPHRYRKACSTQCSGAVAGSKDCLDTADKDRNLQEEYKELAKALVERYFSTKLKIKERLGTSNPETKFEDASKKCQRSRCRSM